MEHVNVVCEKEGYPIVVRNSPTLGNHAVASRDIPQGEGLLRVIPYAAEVFDNYKKRMCQVCLLYHNRGAFTQRCQDCDQVYFCSESCKQLAMDPDMGCHPKICRSYRKLATWNSDRHTKSIIKLLLQVLMNHWRERQGILTAYQNRQAMLRQQQEERDKVQETEKVTEGLAALMIQSESPQKGGVGKHESNIGLKTQDESTTQDQKPFTIPSSSLPPQEEQLQEQQHQEKEREQQKSRIQEPVENDFYDFLLLQSHFEDWDEEDNKDWNKQAQIVLSLLELAGLTEVAWQRDGPTKLMTAQDIKRLISALESNAFGMFDRTKKKPVCFGRAIFPMASYFNHSCECNATAVQADGSPEEVTGRDVLGLLDEEVEKNKTAASSTPNKSMTPSTSSSSLASSTNTLDTPPPSEPSDTKADQIVDGQEQVQELIAADPYESRVGEFRMMTFFSIKDIPEGQDITISYIDTEMPLQARRLHLLSDYHFHCCCTRCVREEKSGAGASAPIPSEASPSTSSSSTSKKKVNKGPSKKELKKEKKAQARVVKK
ncbi:hypothetical protein BGZ83_003948 [Gryganskiella cystojenkinii]|nr:hypothetical protein BGZ83_003948 [Gryganskiella cystojenkinii]